MASNFVLGSDFGKALCARLGLDPEQVHAGVAISAGGDEAFAASLKISLTPDDVAAIGALMQQSEREGEMSSLRRTVQRLRDEAKQAKQVAQTSMAGFVTWKNAQGVPLVPAGQSSDTVVITTPSHLSKEGRDKLSAYVRAQSGCNAMVLDGGATFSGMLKGGPVDASIARLDAHNLT